MNLRRLSLLWKIWLSTSVALTAMFAAIGYLLQLGFQDTATRSLQEEVQSSSKAYEALWEARADQLYALASMLSSMPSTRQAVQSKDKAAIQAVQALWEKAPGKLREQSFLILT